MSVGGEPLRALDDAQIQDFVDHGFVRIDRAFPQTLAREVRAILWGDTGCDPADPMTWTKSVVRLGAYSERPFLEAASTAVLYSAFDQLVGPDRWLPCTAMGTFPVRFPSTQDSGDTGWHVDTSFGSDHPDFLEWRVNVNSKGRALLMLFLFSDVGVEDGPTRILSGSHLDIARSLADAGDAGASLRELLGAIEQMRPGREVLATGEAGTVYLCHPFLVHAAQANRGRRARFVAQPALLPKEPLQLERDNYAYSPVERAIRAALHV